MYEILIRHLGEDITILSSTDYTISITFIPSAPTFALELFALRLLAFMVEEDVRPRVKLARTYWRGLAENLLFLKGSLRLDSQFLVKS